MTSTSPRKADVIVVILSFSVLCLSLGAVDQAGKEVAQRHLCRSNLLSLGKAMLIYANDYDDELPKAGGRTNTWVPALSNWLAPTRQKAHSIERGAGKVTVSSSLYLLVKYSEVHPKLFLCPGEPDKRVFNLNTVPEEVGEGVRLYDAWDFGGHYDANDNPSRHCSYAYHVPFGIYALSTANEPGMPVLADSNPWMDAKRVADPKLGWKQFTSGKQEASSIGNSDAHQRRGQNVLFLDLHVAYENRSTCGIDQDNIYTINPKKDAAGVLKTIMPKVYSKMRPGHRRDSVLIQDSPPCPPKDNDASTQVF